MATTPEPDNHEADTEAPAVRFGPMPAVPVTLGPAADSDDASSVVQASELRLRRFRDVPAFLSAALKLRAAFAESPGALRLSLRAAPHRRTFWTLSQWCTEDELQGFVGHPVHREVMTRFRPVMASSRFVTWSAPGDEAPGWSDAARRLAIPEPAEQGSTQ